MKRQPRQSNAGRITILDESNRSSSSRLLATLFLLGVQSACTPLRSVVVMPNRPSATPIQERHARLVCTQDSPVPLQSAPPMGPPEPSQPSGEPATKASEKPLGPIASTAPGPSLPYTVPGLAYREMATLVAPASIARASGIRGAGEEVSQSLLFSSVGTAGKLGRTTAPTVLQGQVATRFNRNLGPATGFTFASPDNLFNARFNAAGGTGGRCRELAGAGFFGGDHRLCNQTVRRRR